MTDESKERAVQPASADTSDALLQSPSSRANSPPMAVLPLNSSSKLDQEPNPFEQSFSGAAAALEVKDDKPETSKPVLPPVASLTSPSVSLINSGVLPKEVSNQFTWETLRTGPLSPSMLQGPANPTDFNTYRANGSVMREPDTQNNEGVLFADHQPQLKSEDDETSATEDYIQKRKSQDPKKQKQPTEEGTSRRSTRRKASTSESDGGAPKKRQRSASKEEEVPEDDEKRKNFLERNRIAALKCRQRKKQWLNNLQSKVEYLTGDNERLQMQAEALREEIVNLKTLLLAHKDCPVAQANGFHPNAVQKSMPAMMPQQMMPPIYQNQSQPPHPSQPPQAQVPQPPASSYSQTPTSRPLPSTATLPPAQFQSGMQPRMMAGGSSSVLRF